MLTLFNSNRKNAIYSIGFNFQAPVNNNLYFFDIMYLEHALLQGILLTGAPGTGKTLLAKVRVCHCIQNSLFVSS